MRLSSLLLAALTFCFHSCNNDCPPDPLNNDDIAGYIDGSTGILFTTKADRQEVLANLDASPHEGSLYKMPVFEHDNEQVYLLFQVAEVDRPAEFVNYRHSDYCFEELFIDLENELMDIIERNEDNLADQFVMACGDALGQIGKEEEANENIRKGKEQESLDKLKEKKESKNQLKKEITKTAKKKGGEAKDALDNDDKDTAKEKAKELKDEFKDYYREFFRYQWCRDWEFRLMYNNYYKGSNATKPAPELIKEFAKDNIRYKVYKSANCGKSFTPPYITCWKNMPFDSIPAPIVWNTVEKLPRKNCERGTGFCVEQEVVLALDKDYSDSLCTRLISVKPVKGFACFD